LTEPGYAIALRDWLACATAGRSEPGARAARAIGGGTLERAAAAATAGHALDFDDTYTPGLAHLSAPTAPVALVLGAERGASAGDVLAAYAAGFEAMGAIAAASHPALYERGWHPTAVCGVAGAAVTAARLIGLDPERERAALALALLRAGGLRAGFGSDGKSIAVGRAAADGVAAALLAERGARAPLESAIAGFEASVGGRFSEPAAAAIGENWIKAYPCCLQTHSAIEAADRAGSPSGEVVVTVHPLSLAAAAIEDPADGLQAKFSIPYLVAFTLLHGAPRVESFAGVDAEARELAATRVSVRTDAALGESEARLEGGGDRLTVEAALGSPIRPMTEEGLTAKVRDLAGSRLDGVLDDPSTPARAVLEAAGL
jgi:2-methylcitrate dehydratase PrpD